MSDDAQGETWQETSGTRMVAVGALLAVAWVALLVLKLGLGYALKLTARLYVQHYEERQAKGRRVVTAQNPYTAYSIVVPRHASPSDEHGMTA